MEGGGVLPALAGGERTSRPRPQVRRDGPPWDALGDAGRGGCHFRAARRFELRERERVCRHKQ